MTIRTTGLSGDTRGQDLVEALRAIGLDCRVDARDRMALIAVRQGSDTLVDDARRAEVVALARAHGFTHVALDVPPAPAS